MRPYLSPPRTAEQIQPTCQEQWGSYKSKATSSSNLDRWQHEDNKVPHDPITPKITAASTPTTSLSKCVTPKISNPVKTSEVQPSTSKNETDKYVIPKISRQGKQSSKLNELVAKVSPPAQTVLQRPPTLPRKSPPRNISGTRSTRKMR